MKPAVLCNTAVVLSYQAPPLTPFDKDSVYSCILCSSLEVIVSMTDVEPILSFIPVSDRNVWCSLDKWLSNKVIHFIVELLLAIVSLAAAEAYLLKIIKAVFFFPNGKFQLMGELRHTHPFLG